ncbi:MAG: membrane protein insertase YidC [Gammaproteobacteria bacterium]|nr:membrane protein insertase YidC [Gammaproteobacteria bacterium]
MDNQKLILFLALSLVVMLIFQAWEEQFAKPQAPVAQSPITAPTTPPTSSDLPSSGLPNSGLPGSSLPNTVSSIDMPSDLPVPKAAQGVEDIKLTKTGKRIYIQSDVLTVEIDTVGGDLRKIDLVKYPATVNKPDVGFTILNDTLPRYFVAQTGLISKNGAAPDHHTLYDVQQTNYKLDAGSDKINVILNWSDPKGMSVSKIYTFHRDSYVIDVDYVVKNNSESAWKGSLYRQLQRTKVSEIGQSSLIYTYMGGVISTSVNPYEKIDFSEMSDWRSQESYMQGGWAAMLQHYFLAALIPAQDELNHFYTKSIEDTRYIIGMTSQEKIVGVDEEIQFTSQFYVGPKDQNRMEKAVNNLDRTVDYGIFWVIAKPIFITLDYIHGVLGNWGWSIIVLTFLIKLVFYKLSEASYKSMARMRRFQPKITDIRERYGSDKQRMSQALMGLYKKEKINPLRGCLPMLVQIPVFISLYWVLLESVELRQADFIFWFNDLSTKDPFYVLPVIMGVTMYIQQKLNPAPMDPVQQKVMMALPFIFTAFFAFFPSGLVLYWIANNLLTIAQQWYVLRQYEKSNPA